MDIKKWPMDEIMLLPDHLFGRRWPIRLVVKGKAASPAFAISPQGLPETIVLWYVQVTQLREILDESRFELRLGDTLPTTWAQFLLNDLLLPRPGVMAALGEEIRASSYMAPTFAFLRMPVNAGGRRIVLGIDQGVATDNDIQAIVVISSIPRKIPRCLLSE